MFRLFEKDLYKDDKPLGLAEDAADEIETNFGPDGVYKFTEDGDVLSSAIVNSLEKSPAYLLRKQRLRMRSALMAPLP
jgi:hypothetical protein